MADAGNSRHIVSGSMTLDRFCASFFLSMESESAVRIKLFCREQIEMAVRTRRGLIALLSFSLIWFLSLTGLVAAKGAIVFEAIGFGKLTNAAQFCVLVRWTDRIFAHALWFSPQTYLSQMDNAGLCDFTFCGGLALRFCWVVLWVRSFCWRFMQRLARFARGGTFFGRMRSFSWTDI